MYRTNLGVLHATQRNHLMVSLSREVTKIFINHRHEAVVEWYRPGGNHMEAQYAVRVEKQGGSCLLCLYGKCRYATAYEKKGISYIKVSFVRCAIYYAT